MAARRAAVKPRTEVPINQCADIQPRQLRAAASRNVASLATLARLKAAGKSRTRGAHNLLVHIQRCPMESSPAGQIQTLIVAHVGDASFHSPDRVNLG